MQYRASVLDISYFKSVFRTPCNSTLRERLSFENEDHHCDEAEAKIEHDTKVTNQGQRHAHDHRGEDEIEGGDLKHVAVRVWVCVDIFVLSGHVQRLGTTILTGSLLG